MNVVVVFPKIENARSIKHILQQSGYDVTAVCTTGAQALQHANSLDSGILICGYRFVDMMYTELHEYLPKGFEMLLVASPTICDSRSTDNLVCLSMPLKVHELVDTMNMMSGMIAREKKKMRTKPKVRSEREQTLLNDAKAILMERNNLTEEEAHRYMQKRSMDNGTDLVETAEMILSLMSR